MFACPVTVGHPPPPNPPAGVGEDVLPASERLAIQSAIRHLHTQVGHPENRSLARAIRISGGSEHAKPALQHRCAACQNVTEPTPALPAQLKKWKEFNECVYLDTFTLGDSRGNVFELLNMGDWASVYQMVWPIKGRHPITAWDTFLDKWCSWAGPPLNPRVDGGGEFERQFRQECESMFINVYTAAAHRPQQNAIAERHGGMWKHVARALINFQLASIIPACCIGFACLL